MLRTFYLSAWITTAAAAITLIFAGYPDPATLLVFSLLSLALVLGLAIWLVIVNTYDLSLDAVSAEHKAW